MMSADDRKNLGADILLNGLREDIWTYEGKIVDGRNRYLACVDFGVEPRYREWSGRGSLVSFVVSLNLTRRHLSESQRAMVAARLTEEFSKETDYGHKSAAAAERWDRQRETDNVRNDPLLSYDEKQSIIGYLETAWKRKNRTESNRASRQLYVMHDDQRMKIGVSSLPESRLSALKAGVPSLKLIASCPGSFSDEKELHALLESFSVGGEWFRVSDESLAIVEKFMQNRQLADKHISATQAAARMMNVGVRSVERAAKVQKDGVPELAEMVEAGTIAVSQAARIAELPKGKQKRLIRRGRDSGKKILTRLKTKSIERMIKTGSHCLGCDPAAEFTSESVSAFMQTLATRSPQFARFFTDVVEELELDKMSDSTRSHYDVILTAIDSGLCEKTDLQKASGLGRDEFTYAIAVMLDYDMIDAVSQGGKTDAARGAAKTIYRRKEKSADDVRELEYVAMDFE